MAVFTLEDLQSAIEVMVFPRSMQECGALLADDAVVCVKGRLDKGRVEEPTKLICMQVKRPDVSSDPCPPVRIKLSPLSLSESLLGRLKSLLRDHPGESPVFVHLDRAGGPMAEVPLPSEGVVDVERRGIVLRLPDEFRVDSRNGLFAELRVLLGPNGLVT
jgi:DNA polymerase-3 subunit alpha